VTLHRSLSIFATLALFIVAIPAATVALAQPATCATASHLTGSNFEIDTNANLRVDGAAPCIDWLNDANTTLRSGVLVKQDKASGGTDDSFGQGTKEDDANPTIVQGSIPPNKSDLKTFAVFTETNGSAKFLELFWSRVQNPSGTTNMDFELNQKFCDPSATPTNCANNGSGVTPETPVRTLHDKLITYDLSRGGTVPTISIRDWNGSAWGPATVISGTANPLAIGSVNTTDIPASGNGDQGAQSAFTFGEAAVSFAALFPPGSGQCGLFGSAYLKSRSSDSFTSEVKDFIAPERVTITNCATIVTTLSDADSTITVGDSIHDSAVLTGAGATAGGTVTYTVYTDTACTANPRDAGTKTVVNGVVPDSNTLQFSSAGTFYWQASYSGDSNNSPAKSACTSETLVVEKIQPAIATLLSASQVNIGDSVTDSATLTNATSNASGTVAYKVYSNNTCTGTSTDAGTKTVANGIVPNSNPVQFNTAGTFYWQAFYDGDANNKSALSDCTTEQLIVKANLTTINTTLSSLVPVSIGSSVHDSATLGNATATAGGSVTYTVYTNNTCTTGAVDAGTFTVTNGVVPDSNAIQFNNAGSFYWQASYTGDANNAPAISVCTSELLVVDKNPTGMTTALDLIPNDAATLSGIAAGTGGTVTFKLFSPSDASCSGAAAISQTVNAPTSGTYNTTNTTFHATDPGTWRWLVTYSGDNNNLPSSSGCGDEQFTLVNDTVATQ